MKQPVDQRKGKANESPYKLKPPSIGAVSLIVLNCATVSYLLGIWSGDSRWGFTGLVLTIVGAACGLGWIVKKMDESAD